MCAFAKLQKIAIIDAYLRADTNQFFIHDVIKKNPALPLKLSISALQIPLSKKAKRRDQNFLKVSV